MSVSVALLFGCGSQGKGQTVGIAQISTDGEACPKSGGHVMNDADILGRSQSQRSQSQIEMTYRVYGLEAMKSPVVLRTAAGEQEFHNGREAGDAAFDRRYLIASIYAEESKIIVELEENKGFQNEDWADPRSICLTGINVPERDQGIEVGETECEKTF